MAKKSSVHPCIMILQGGYQYKEQLDQSSRIFVQVSTLEIGRRVV